MKLLGFAAAVLASVPAWTQTAAPTLTAVAPESGIAGSAGITVTLTGTNFVPASQVFWNNAILLQSTYFSSTQLAAGIPGGLLTTAGTAVLHVQNPDGTRSATRVFTITQSNLAITSEALTEAAVGSPYTLSLAATGGTAPYTWAVVSGALPPGLVLSQTGTIFGTPSQTGTFSFAVRATDRQQVSVQKALQLVVKPPALAITTASPLPAATVGVLYTQQLAASGGVPPYRWAINAPPAGLALDAATGVLTGTPTAHGSFAFTLQVVDSAGTSTTKAVSLLVNPPPLVLSTTAVFPATVGLAYSQTFTATGGIPPYRWTLVSGALAAGLTFDAGSATISGTPQNTGSFSFTIQVADSTNVTASRTYSLVVESSRVSILTPSPLPGGMVGSRYSQRFTAAGGTPPYTWSSTAGLVPGLSLDPGTGALEGTPSAAGAFTITVAVRDAASGTASRAYSITINPSPLTLTSPRELPAGLVGEPLAFRLEASGGSPPYSWTANGLPDGLTLDASSGLLSGAPKVPGAFSFAVRVTDAARATVLELFRITIGVPAVPDLVLRGLPASLEPASQPALELSLAAPFPVDLTGQLDLTFAPDTSGGDPAIVFSNGQRSVAFTIPANTTAASFPIGALALQSGTVAGNIRIAARLQAAGVEVTPTPPPAFNSRVERAAPRIGRLSVARSASGLTVQITGFCTAREITEAVFRFTVTGGATLQTPEIRVPVENLFAPWFQDPASARFGSQFTFSQQFNVQGDASALTLDSVTLTNRLGSAQGRP